MDGGVAGGGRAVRQPDQRSKQGIPRAFALILAGSVGIAGCTSGGRVVGDVATAGVGAAIGAATGSALIGIAAGVAASFGINEGVKYGERRIQDNVQRAIARTAGPLADGQSARWQVEEILPLSGKSGTVEVVRSFGRRIPCKEVVFTLDDDMKADAKKAATPLEAAQPAGLEPAAFFYVGAVCQGLYGWQWAVSEPSVHRWGSLQ